MSHAYDSLRKENMSNLRDAKSYTSSKTPLLNYKGHDNVLLQAPSYEREDFCSAYLRDNVWVDVVIALGLAAFVIVVCVCICKSCCSNARYRGVVLPGQTGPGGVTVVNSQNSQMTQQHPGYPMHPPPGGNPA
uniref:Uncharacterized protein LOC111128706 n=1 Tax=Crassostrea virginica TaxID=6565 RepID=A0A8B8DRA5_CRAVI|nr:uncharacterized protein LOC111128706 [Crassostrea virginica]